MLISLLDLINDLKSSNKQFEIDDDIVEKAAKILQKTR